MNLIHQDGRRQTIPDDAWQRHQATYTRAGWREDVAAVASVPGAVREPTIKIRSKHGEERNVTEAQYAETFESAGWTRPDLADEDAEAETKPAPKFVNRRQGGAQR